MTPGIHRIPMADYLADPCIEPSLSSSCAHRLITRSPYHAWFEHPRLGGNKRGESGVADRGSVSHDLLLGGEGKICVIDPRDYPSKTGEVPKGWTNNAIREARDTAYANGLTPILSMDYGAAKNMQKAALDFIASTEIAGVFSRADRSDPELTIIWREGCAWCRARPDWMNFDKKVMLHYKTTEASARPESFIRGVMASMGYEMAMAFYRRGLEAVMPEATDWLHVMLVQEQKPPYACSLIGLSPVALAVAEDDVVLALGLWKKCMASNHWPAYDNRIHYSEPPAWKLAENEWWKLNEQEMTE